MSFMGGLEKSTDDERSKELDFCSLEKRWLKGIQEFFPKHNCSRDVGTPSTKIRGDRKTAVGANGFKSPSR